MATPAPNFGPAQPLGDAYSNAMGKVFDVLRMLHMIPAPPAPKPAQPGADPYMLQNDPDVARANQSFRDADAAKQRQAAHQSLGRVTPKGK